MQQEEIWKDISKKEALAIDQKWYFTNTACKNGHIDKRYVNTGICYSCKRDINKRNRLNNPETTKKISDRDYIKNKKNRVACSKIWISNNLDKVKKIKQRNKQKHKVKYLEAEKERNKKRRKTDPFWRLSKNMSKAIWECLKNNKKQLSWLTFVDYSIDELKIHLESKFDEDMSWKNYGSYWHIDHIRPLSWFNLEKEFKEAWCLNNLQPLEAIKNYSKGNKYEG